MRASVWFIGLGCALGTASLSLAADAPPAPVEGVVPRFPGVLVKTGDWASEFSLSIPSETKDGVTPQVGVSLSAGRLFVSTDVPEEAGIVSGVRWIVGPEGTKSAADAITLAYSPHDSRTARYVVRGPAGQGRSIYRFVGDFSQASSTSATGQAGEGWRAVTSIPIEDLRLASDDVPLRLAVIVTLRKPNLIAAAPAGSAFGPVASFALLKPPEGGWTAGAKATLDAKAIADEDAADARRLEGWGKFVDAWTAARRSGAGDRAAIVGPLDAAIAARPDLAVLRLAKGEVLGALGDRPASRAAFAEGVALLPIREARWSLARLEVGDWVEPEGDVPADYEGTFAKIAKAREGRRPDDPGIALAEAVLFHRRGDFSKAQERFDAVVPRWPVGDDTAKMSLANKKYEQAFAIELGYRLRDEEKNLPRVRVVTSKGAIDLELFEDDAPNSVANFLWLANAKFYDGTTFHRVEPFFVAQGGDPFSKDPIVRAGEGGPGYAIPTERSRRLPFRGVVGFAHHAPDDEGSQFFVTTGTAAHLEGDFSIFGRVIAGQDVAEKLVRGDRLERVEVLRARAHDYRPTTVAGKPAPAPVATLPMGPK